MTVEAPNIDIGADPERVVSDLVAQANAGANLAYALYHSGTQFMLTLPAPVARAYAAAGRAYQIGQYSRREHAEGGLDLEAVRDRHRLAQTAGEDLEYGSPEIAADSRIQAIVRSWQDVAELHDALKRQ